MSTYKTTMSVTKEYRPPTHASVGRERDTPYRVGRRPSWRAMCLTPHGFPVLVNLLFRNGLKCRPAAEMVARLAGALGRSNRSLPWVW